MTGKQIRTKWQVFKSVTRKTKQRTLIAHIYKSSLSRVVILDTHEAGGQNPQVSSLLLLGSPTPFSSASPAAQTSHHAVDFVHSLAKAGGLEAGGEAGLQQGPIVQPAIEVVAAHSQAPFREALAGLQDSCQDLRRQVGRRGLHRGWPAEACGGRRRP